MQLCQLIDDGGRRRKTPHEDEPEDGDRETPDRASASRRRAAARQAGRHHFQRRAAEGQAPVQAQKGRPHRHPGSLRRPACCRCASARPPSSPPPARCRQELRAEVNSASRPPPAMPKARSSSTARSTVDAATSSAVLPRFTGEIEQMPPMHSALKHAGRPLYELRPRRASRSSGRRAGSTIHALTCNAATAPSW